MTTAVIELFKLNWSRAYEINGFAPVVVLLIGVIFAKETLKMEKNNG